MGWFMLDKYYTMTEDAPVYAAALLLDPSKRMKYIERHWPESWHDNAISGARAIWEEEYKTHFESGSIEVTGEMSASHKRESNEWDSLLEEMEVTEDMGNSVDDFESFIKASPARPMKQNEDHKVVETIFEAVVPEEHPHQERLLYTYCHNHTRAETGKTGYNRPQGRWKGQPNTTMSFGTQEKIHLSRKAASFEDVILT